MNATARTLRNARTLALVSRPTRSRRSRSAPSTMRTLEHFETQYYIQHQTTQLKTKSTSHFTYVVCSISRLSLCLLTNPVRTSLAPLRRIFNVDLTTFSQVNPEYFPFCGVAWSGYGSVLRCGCRRCLRRGGRRRTTVVVSCVVCRV
jgi:hypothetical protein